MDPEDTTIGERHEGNHRELHEIHEDFEDARRRYARAGEDLGRYFDEFRNAVQAGQIWREPAGAGA